MLCGKNYSHKTMTFNSVINISEIFDNNFSPHVEKDHNIKLFVKWLQMHKHWQLHQNL